jgi:hypothetical protein
MEFFRGDALVAWAWDYGVETMILFRLDAEFYIASRAIFLCRDIGAWNQILSIVYRLLATCGCRACRHRSAWPIGRVSQKVAR